jgi:hypothetical protein
MRWECVKSPLFGDFQRLWEGRETSRLVWRGLKDESTNSVPGIGGRVADVFEGIGAEAFGQLGEV